MSYHIFFFLYYDNSVYSLANMSSGINQICLRGIGQQYNILPENCVYVSNVIPYIKTPIFTWHSKYDTFQILKVFKNSSIEGMHIYIYIYIMHIIYIITM